MLLVSPSGVVHTFSSPVHEAPGMGVSLGAAHAVHIFHAVYKRLAKSVDI